MSSSENQAVLIFIVGTTGMLFMAGVIILFVTFYQKRMIQEQYRRQVLEIEYQKKMLQAALESQESERKRVSKDLHDDVGMMLMTVRTQMSSLIGKTFSQEMAGSLREMVDETHESVRRISWDLMPSTLERFGLLQTIKEMCSRLSSSDSVPVEFGEEGIPTTLDKNEETLLYRVVQESVSNALRHAQAKKIDVLFSWEEKGLRVLIKDDGIGFDFPQEKGILKSRQGLGLINVENRVTLLGAQLHYGKNNPSGTIVNLLLPIRRHE